MSGCDFQLTSHRADQGTTLHVRAIWLALILSLVVHIGAAYFAGGVVMEADGSSSHRVRMASPGPLMTLDFEPPPDEARAPDPQPSPTALANVPIPPPPPAIKPPEPERDKPLHLGIADSDQKSPNWLGFKDPTEHMAPKSEVEQPALDPNAGRPGEPAPATPPTPPAPADPMEAPTLVPPPTVVPEPVEEVRPTPPAMDTTPTPPPTPVELQPSPTQPETPPPAPPIQVAPNTPPGEALEMIEAQQPRLGDPEPSPEPPAAAKADPAAMPDPNHPALTEGFVGPLPREFVALLDARKPREKGVTDGVPNSVADRAREAAMPRPSAPASRPTPVQPARQPVPGGPATSNARPAPPATPSGNNADRPAEQSEKQADATALTETIDIRPGRPAAAQGLDIVTRRPNFTRLTRVVAAPNNNPLVRITFSRSGIVVKAELLESSGTSEIDDPVINAIYQWTARGKNLDELPNENSTLSVKVRIILR